MPNLFSFSESNAWNTSVPVRFASSIENQTVFLRRFKFALSNRPTAQLFGRFKISCLPSKRAKATALSGASGSLSPSSPSSSLSLSGDSRDSQRLVTRDSRLLVDSDKSGDPSANSSEDDGDSPVGTEPFHPSNIINDDLPPSNDSFDVANTHDDDSCSLLTDQDDEFPDDQELKRRLQEKYEVVIERGAIQLCLCAGCTASNQAFQFDDLSALDSDIFMTGNRYRGIALVPAFGSGKKRVRDDADDETVRVTRSKTESPQSTTVLELPNNACRDPSSDGSSRSTKDNAGNDGHGGSPRSNFMNNHPWNNPRYMARSPSFGRDTSFGSTQRQNSQSDTFSSGHSSNTQSHAFTRNEQSLYPGATSLPVHCHDFQPRSLTPSLPSRTLSRISSLDGRAEDLQCGQLDQGMGEQREELLEYLPPGFQKRSPAEIETFRQLSRQEQLAENQARQVTCGWTDQGGLQSCTVVMTAKDMRKHIENFHNVPRPRRGEPSRICHWIHCGSSERDLYKHIGVVHCGLQQISCDSCDREFSRTDQLKAHMESCGRRGN
ncbi:hypothetical protein C8J56DRAFT_591881 [Mycena floridula]|nr:hypothetical protein C8J56DRAFT_591881 [Mycena floridula]